MKAIFQKQSNIAFYQTFNTSRKLDNKAEKAKKLDSGKMNS